MLVATVLAACGGDGSTVKGDGGPAEPRNLVLSNYENYMPEDLIPSFEKETGINVTVVNHTSNEEIVGKMDASSGDPGFDMAVVAGPFAEAMAKREWLAEIDHSKVPNMSYLAPEATELSYDVGNRYSVPYTWGTTGICYRSDLVRAL